MPFFEFAPRQDKDVGGGITFINADVVLTEGEDSLMATVSDMEEGEKLRKRLGQDVLVVDTDGTDGSLFLNTRPKEKISFAKNPKTLGNVVFGK